MKRSSSGSTLRMGRSSSTSFLRSWWTLMASRREVGFRVDQRRWKASLVRMRLPRIVIAAMDTMSSFLGLRPVVSQSSDTTSSGVRLIEQEFVGAVVELDPVDLRVGNEVAASPRSPSNQPEMVAVAQHLLATASPPSAPRAADRGRAVDSSLSRTMASSSRRPVLMARSCDRSRTSMRNDSALFRSRRSRRPGRSAAQARRGAAAVEASMTPFSMESMRTPCTMGKVPDFLMWIDVGADADRHHQRGEHAGAGVLELVDGLGEAGEIGALAAHQFDHDGLGLGHQFGAPGHRHGVEEDAEVHGAHVVGRQDPALELVDELVDASATIADCAP